MIFQIFSRLLQTFYEQILTAFQYGIGANSLTFISSVAFVGLHRNGKWLQTDNKFGITADFRAPSGGRSRSPRWKVIGTLHWHRVCKLCNSCAYSNRVFKALFLTFLGRVLDWVRPILIVVEFVNWVKRPVSVQIVLGPPIVVAHSKSCKAFSLVILS